jgi:CRISPR-associated protein Cmr1
MMNRKPPKMDAPNVNYQKDKKAIHQVRHYKVITPLYGGGVEPAESDPITTIRGTEIRGQLRFWWRALRGNRNGGKWSDMQSFEGRIWGSSEEPSAVKIAIHNIRPGEKFQAEDYRNRPIDDISHYRSKDSYVAFPLRDQQSHGQSIQLRWKIEFDLEIVYPKKIMTEVDAALWAWETFGGIGARTRRGFGALTLLDIVEGDQTDALLKTNNLKETIRKNLVKWVGSAPFPAGVPHLSANAEIKVVQNSKGDVLAAWRYLHNKYRDFRLSRPNMRTTHPGRSHWPEADVIRRHVPDPHRRHKPIHPVKNKMPRGKFGLPVVFQFKHRDDPSGNTILQGTDEIERMASPLIFRPIQCSDNAIGIAVILEWHPLHSEDEPYTPPGGLRLVRNEHTSWTVDSDLNPSEANAIKPMQPTGETDPLKAFLKTLR